MADLTELKQAMAVEITDTSGTNEAKINTSLPGVSDAALTVREARQGQQTSANSIPVVMASDITFPIVSFLDGNKIYSIAENINQTSAGSDNPLVLMRNPSGSGKTFYFYKLITGVNVTNVASNFKVFINPTITTNGTSVTPVSLNIGGGAPASVMLLTTLPTVSASGTVIYTYVSGQNSYSVNYIDDFSIRVNANNSILITGDPASNNREAVITLVWMEQ
jgi:hypothetical protein